MQDLTIIRPDDWHTHLRDGAALARVVADTARRFARAIVMPNLDPPVTTVAAAAGYRERILAALGEGVDFEPLMTLYLSDATSRAEIRAAHASGFVHAAKLYPAGATTHSEYGVSDIEAIAAALDEMQRYDLPLLVHGETTDPEVDVFDRERVFIERTLSELVARYPGLRIVLEHVSTATGVEFVRAAPPRVAATVTAHHLLLNRNALLAGRLAPHHYCAPILKREGDRQALLKAASGDDPSFFLGSDSAPHPRTAKEAAHGCAGIYTAHAAIELYAEAFAEVGALDRLEDFASRRGAAFYGLPLNTDSLTLERADWTVPPAIDLGGRALVPLRASAAVGWRLAGR